VVAAPLTQLGPEVALRFHGVHITDLGALGWLRALLLQQLAGYPQRAAGGQGRRVFVESVVRQTQLAHVAREVAAPPGSRCVRIVGVVVQEEGQRGRGEPEVQAAEDETLQVAELLLGERVAAQSEEMADARRAHLHLGDHGERERERDLVSGDESNGQSWRREYEAAPACSPGGAQ